MSNILKSTKLDIALVKPYFKTICFTLLLPIVFAAINRSLLTGVSFAMCFIAMTTGYTFSITEKTVWIVCLVFYLFVKASLWSDAMFSSLQWGFFPWLFLWLHSRLSWKCWVKQLAHLTLWPPLLQEYSYLHSILCSRFRDITSTVQSKDGYLCIFQWPVFGYFTSSL